MTELARLKDEGRIEVIRERNANYHVFTFVDGKRPDDRLITAALEAAGAPPDEEAHHATQQPEKPAKTPKTTKSAKTGKRPAVLKKTKPNSKTKRSRRH